MASRLERIISLFGSLASILGVSALSAVAIIQSFKAQAFDIGYKLLLSGGAVMVLTMIFPFFLWIFKFFLQLLFNTNQLDEDEDDEDADFLNVLGIVYISISLIVYIGLLVGAFLMIWSHDF